MAKFCTNCGKELKDGKPCNCKNNLKEEKKVNGVDFEGILTTFKKFFTKPISTVKDLISENNFNKAICLIAISSVLVGLLSILYMKQIVCYDCYYMQYDNQYFKIFMHDGLLAASMYLILSSVLYLVFKICNKDIEFKKLLIISSAVALPLTIATMINIVLFALSIGVEFILYVFIIGGIMSTIMLYESIEDIFKNKDKSLFMLVATIFGSLFLYYIINIMFLG